MWEGGEAGQCLPKGEGMEPIGFQMELHKAGGQRWGGLTLVQSQKVVFQAEFSQAVQTSQAFKAGEMIGISTQNLTETK